MNEWERNRRMADRYRAQYPPGTRLMLLSMDDPYWNCHKWLKENGPILLEMMSK